MLEASQVQALHIVIADVFAVEHLNYLRWLAVNASGVTPEWITLQVLNLERFMWTYKNTYQWTPQAWQKTGQAGVIVEVLHRLTPHN